MNYKGENYYIYIISPIDCFENSMNIEQYARKELDNYFFGDSDLTLGGLFLGDYSCPDFETILSKYEKAKLDISSTSKQRGVAWELDFRGDPVMFSVPCESKFEVGFVIKQDNNGTTFVASPVPLPHLEHLDWRLY